MPSLEDKLREILKDYIGNDLTTIRQIKQAFADDGYWSKKSLKISFSNEQFEIPVRYVSQQEYDQMTKTVQGEQ